jgi:hypothetical protein
LVESVGRRDSGEGRVMATRVDPAKARYDAANAAVRAAMIKKGPYGRWDLLTEPAWDILRAWGRRWAYYGSDNLTIRIIRWYKSGVRVRFADGHQETVHPHDIHLHRYTPAAEKV